MTAGYSGEDVRATATQLRLFGKAPGKVDFFTEVAWGDRWAGDAPVIGGGLSGVDPTGTDVFGAAYPYGGRTVLMEMSRSATSVRAERCSGCAPADSACPSASTAAATTATRILRPPLIRHDGYSASRITGSKRARCSRQASRSCSSKPVVSRPHDVGFAVRRNGTDASVRVQGYRGQFIVGASYARSNPYLSPRFAVGRQAFAGADVRWAHPSGLPGAW